MGVNGDCRLIEGMSQHDISGFPAYTREACQLFHRRGYPAVELVDELSPAAPERYGFSAKQTETANERFDIAERSVSERAWGRETIE